MEGKDAFDNIRNKLEPVEQHIINEAQTGFIKGHSIDCNIRHANLYIIDIAGMILTFTFDSHATSLLIKPYFGPIFRSIIGIIYNNISASVK